MDKTVPENQVVYRSQQDYRDVTDLDCTVCLLALGIHRIPIEAEEMHAANTAPITAQSV